MLISKNGVLRDAAVEEESAILEQQLLDRDAPLFLSSYRRTLTPLQFNLMLLQLDMTWNDIQSQIAAIEDPQTRAVADVEFNRAGYFRRDHWLVKELAVAMKFSDTELDTLWSYAAEL